jgi:hypothetical protein
LALIERCHELCVYTAMLTNDRRHELNDDKEIRIFLTTFVLNVVEFQVARSIH